MPTVSKIVKCVDCGKEYPRKELNRKWRCPDCGMNKMVAVIRGMYYKSGPEYEHWKKQTKRSLRRL